MKRVKTFESFIYEAAGKKFSNADIKKLVGIKAEEDTDFEFDPEEGYMSVQSFVLDHPKISDDYPLYLNIYDGNEFCFWQDSAPIPLSIHTPSQVRFMTRGQSEQPLPLNKLNKSIVDEVIKTASEYGQD
jgi:hypothetical protein